MLTILIANQKGGVGKTTIADELAFELERRGASVSFISTDPQGGSVHETDDGDEERDWRIVDTPGVLADALPEWCEAADMVLVPMLPSPRDIEPTLRTIEVARKSTSAPVAVVVNQYNPYGVLDRQLAEYLAGEGERVIAKVPKAVALAQAAAGGCSVAGLRKPPKGGVYDKTGNMLSGYGWVAALLVVAAVAGAGYAGKQYLDARKEKDGDADGGES